MQQQRSRFLELLPDVDVAAPLEVLEAQEPTGATGIGPRNDAQHLLEEGLVAGDGQGPVVGEAVLFLGLNQELLEDRVVQVRRAHDEPPAAAPHAYRHVSRRHVGRRRLGRSDARLPAPPLQHLADSDNVPDLVVGPSDHRSHFFPFLFPGKRRKTRESEKFSEK